MEAYSFFFYIYIFFTLFQINLRKLHTDNKTLKERVIFRAFSNSYGHLTFREALGVTLHKDSRFYESWQNFKDNNQFVNSKFNDWILRNTDWWLQNFEDDFAFLNISLTYWSVTTIQNWSLLFQKCLTWRPNMMRVITSWWELQGPSQTNSQSFLVCIWM